MRSEYLNKIENLIVGGDRPFVLRRDIFALIIGLGGSGVGYVKKIKEMFYERYSADVVDRQMGFLCIDTPALKEEDEKYIAKSEYIQLTHGVYDDAMKDWVDPDVMERLNKLPTDAPGAGGVRMMGRIKLFSSRANVIRTFRERFVQYFGRAGFENVRNFYVIEIASICGGTGCGTFIDIPYFIRHAIKSANLNDRKITFFGFLELPDSKINRERDKINDTDQRQFKRNGYAALKELQYFMQDRAVWSEKIGENFEVVTFDDKRIFDACFLLSSNAIQIDGTTLDYDKNVPKYDGTKNYYFDQAIPEMINIMLSRREDTPIAHESPYVGFDEVLNNVLSQEKEDPNISHKPIFSTAGVSKIEVPLNEIIICLFNRIFVGLNERWNLIEDKDLIEKIVKNDIAPAFNIKSLFEKIEENLDIEGLTNSELFERDFEDTIKSKLSGNLKTKLNNNFIKALDDRIDVVYKEYGPFMTAKVLEKNVYEGMIDEYIEKEIKRYINENYLNGDEEELPKIGSIQKLIKDYKDFNPNFLGIKIKTDEEKKMRKKLINNIKIYFVPKIIDFINEVKKARYDIINDDVHHNLFVKIEEMIKNFSTLMYDITGVNTIVTDQQNIDGKVVTWDFSNVDYKAVSAKLNYLFSKKIVYLDDNLKKENEVITKDDIFLVKNNVVTNKKIFSKRKDTRNQISVRTKYIDQGTGRKLEKTFDKVLSITDVITISGHESDKINFEEFLSEFLLAIKNNTQGDIFDIMIEHFQKFIDVFLDLQFEDKIFMFSQNYDPSKNPNDLTQEEKEKLLKDAFRNYTNFFLPSFPVINNRINDQITNQRNFVVSIRPNLDPNTLKIMKDSRGKMVIRDEVPIVRNRLNSMITVAFYFEYSLNSYRHLEDCRAQYEREKTMGGLHLAEGTGNDKEKDWSKFPEIDKA